MFLKLISISIILSLVNQSYTQLRVFGGSTVEFRKYPYQVSIRRTSNKHICGGSIISNNWIVSAAHCVYRKSPSDLFLVVGTNFVHTGGTRYEIKTIIRHENFTLLPSFQNDISVLQSATKINYTTTVQPISLQSNDIGAGNNGVATGWGQSELVKESENLQEIQLTTITVTECQVLIPEGIINQKNVCTLAPEGYGMCRGDSGGPFAIHGVLTGIVSWGIPCALGVPDVFTSVAAFRSWIKFHTDV